MHLAHYTRELEELQAGAPEHSWRHTREILERAYGGDIDGGEPIFADRDQVETECEGGKHCIERKHVTVRKEMLDKYGYNGEPAICPGCSEVEAGNDGILTATSAADYYVRE